VTQKPPTDSRSRWRSRSHEEAHKDADGSPPQAPADTPDIVESGADLADLVAHLRLDGSFAYDSEFISESSYFPKLCLVQVASHRRIALIDPLAGLDLTPFWELLADPAVQKIVHAGAQDIEPVVRHLDRPAANVFDTQIAAGFAGLPYPISLKKLVSELTDSRLGRDLGFSNWDQRPLSSSQLRYAADDVRYLPAAADELLRRLDILGRRDAAAQECAAACAPDLFRFNPEAQFLRVRGTDALSPRSLGVLRELAVWRDGAARRADLPPRAFLKDEVLVGLAVDPATSVHKLSAIRGLPKAIQHSDGAAIVKATQHALSLPPVGLPGAAEPEPGPAEKFRADAFFAAVQGICSGLSLDPGMVANRKQVGKFYRYCADGGIGEQPMLLRGWRGRLVGDPAAGFLRGETRIEMRWEEGALRAAFV